jgi:hypothetical protein
VPQGGTSGACAADPAPGGGGELCLQTVKIVSPAGVCGSNVLSSACRFTWRCWW